MTNSNSETPPPYHNCISDSPNTEFFYDDGEGDSTVKPIPVELMPQAIAEWQKIQDWLAGRKQQSPGTKGSISPNSETRD